MTALRLVDAAPDSAASGAPSRDLVVQGARAAALLGETPTMTLAADASAPDCCCTVRTVRRGDGTWVGVVDDRSLFADRVRMGLTPRFVAGDARVHAVVGTARARLLGRLDAVAADLRRALDSVVGPWPIGDAVVVELRPESLAVVDDEAPGGPVPQT
jgi:hypothetical protein